MNFQQVLLEDRLGLPRSITPAEVLRRYADQAVLGPAANVRGTKGAGRRS